MKYIDFKKYLLEQVSNGSIYLWGGQGEELSKLTDTYIKNKETSTSNANRVIKLRDSRKAKYPNLHAYDCSGLIVNLLLKEKEITFDMTANGIMNKCKSIKKTELQNGDFVFRVSSGKAYHIGYVVDGKIIHAKGRDYGVVKEDINANGSIYWNAYGRSPWVEPEIDDKAIVKELQKALNDAYNCGLETDGIMGAKTEKAISEHMPAIKADPYVKFIQKMCGITVDGVFDSYTLEAVKDYQKAHGLTVDGQAGIKTIRSMIENEKNN